MSKESDIKTLISSIKFARIVRASRYSKLYKTEHTYWTERIEEYKKELKELLDENWRKKND